jgi:uncharacterized membrane protein
MRSMRSARHLDLDRAAAAALSSLVAVTTLAAIHLTIRPVLAAAFLLWVPGAAAVGFLRLTDRLLAVVLSIAVSIAIGTLGAELMVWTHLWHPRAGTVILAGASAIALLCQPSPVDLSEPRRALDEESADPKQGQ